MGLLSPEVQALYETDPAVKQYLDAMAAQAQPQFGLPADIQPLYDSNPDVKAYWDAMAQNPQFAAQQAANAAAAQAQPQFSLPPEIQTLYDSDPAVKAFWQSMAADPALAKYFGDLAANQQTAGGSTGNAGTYSDPTTGNVLSGINRGAPVGVGNVPNIPLPKNFPTAALGPANDAAHMLALGQQPAFSAAAMRGISPLMQRYLSPVQSSYWQLASQFAQAPYAAKPWGDMPWGQMPINNQTGQLNFAPQGTGNSFNAAMNIVGPMLPQQPTMTPQAGWQSQFPGWAQGANLGLGS